MAAYTAVANQMLLETNGTLLEALQWKSAAIFDVKDGPVLPASRAYVCPPCRATDLRRIFNPEAYQPQAFHVSWLQAWAMSLTSFDPLPMIRHGRRIWPKASRFAIKGVCIFFIPVPTACGASVVVVRGECHASPGVALMDRRWFF